MPRVASEAWQPLIEYVRKCVDESGMSQTRISDVCGDVDGTSQPNINKLIHGKLVKPELPAVRAIVRTTGGSVEHAETLYTAAILRGYLHFGLNVAA